MYLDPDGNPGWQIASASGNGWACDPGVCRTQPARCPGASYPSIVMTIILATNAGPTVTVEQLVVGGGSPSATVTETNSISTLPGTPVLAQSRERRRVELHAGPIGVDCRLQCHLAGPVPGQCHAAAAAHRQDFGESVFSLEPAGRDHLLLADCGSQFKRRHSFRHLVVYDCLLGVGLHRQYRIGTGRAERHAGGLRPGGLPVERHQRCSWITITSGSGMGTQLSYSVAANTGLPKIGTITVGGTSATITQDAEGLGFFPVTPCRVADTRNANGPFGGPTMTAGQTRSFTIPASACNIPATAQAYLAEHHGGAAAALGYLTMWPTGQAQPYVSTLNSSNGAIVANAAIVPAGREGRSACMSATPPT